MLTFEQYVERRIRNKKYKIRKELGHQVITGGKHRNARRAKFFKSEEGKKQLEIAYRANEELQELYHNKKSPMLKAEYEHYVHEVTMLKERKNLEEKRRILREDILKEIPENPIDLYPHARRMHRHFILHVGPTNSGKTYEALEEFKKAENAIYLAPLRLLAFEVFEKSNAAGVPCNMITGEEAIRMPGATHQASTVEMLSVLKDYDLAVIDEAQMIEDTERGGAWTRALLGVPARRIHVCMAAYATKLVIQLIEECGDTYEIVEHHRATPLTVEKGHFVFPQDVTDHDALIVFSKKMVLACAAELQRLGISCSVIYGSLPYDVRTREVDRFLRGENRVIVATDAIGMGMNLPIRRVVFLENEKFDGENKRPLNAKEIQQIAGRAGRRGSFDVGYYTAQFDKKQIAEEVDAIVPPLKQAVLKFPEELISLNGLLSETLSQWDQMASGELYTKAKIEREIKLCKTLEKYTDDKNLIYQFLTIPFNEKSPELYAIWLRLFQSEVDGIGTPLDEILPEIYDKEPLATLELKHQICDLANFYTTRFGVEEDLPRILERKREISDRMAEILGEQNLPMRHCEMCGKELAWNNPYRICNTCHDKKLAQPWLYRGRKSRRW
ncbi:MAG: helicase [Lachnospiraceae bacterium]|nr:helicase [Lachnospiraceae bacterium]MBQ1641369.1 helicase [Lachnospiraceae bacterium]MBQ2317723.1 helicase [Lachnospiraceae bacterium]MBQ2466219.1 helicase [Lachnospiraceae bacterium]MBQ2503530.1 helicase [Lachnospiraceae bacterium]